MNKDVKILVSEGDNECFTLITKSFHKAGIWNEIVRFADKGEMLNYLLEKDGDFVREENKKYLLLIDVHKPDLNGFSVLEKIKEDKELRKIPVIILTNYDNGEFVERCHSFGCNLFLVKPEEPEEFMESVKKIGLFLSVVRFPRINGVK